MNATAAFLGSESDWKAARVELDDVQALWGGRRIVLDGTGRVNVQVIEREMHEQRYELEIDRAEIVDILQRFVDNDFLAIRPSDRPGIPDEARPKITLKNASGQATSVAKWAGVKDARFDALYARLLQVEKLALHRKPFLGR